MSFTANNTYGEYKHKLTVNEMPSHTHKPHFYTLIIANGANTGSLVTSGNNNNNGNTNFFGNDTDKNRYTDSTGGSASHNNIQPSICVYLWRRKS